VSAHVLTVVEHLLPVAALADVNVAIIPSTNIAAAEIFKARMSMCLLTPVITHECR
jgi:hypothetical protein